MPVNDTAWIIGFAIGAAIVVVVVILVGTILYLAASIRKQAGEVLAALEESRANTEPLWEVEKTNSVAQEIVDLAAKARAALGG